MVGIGRYPPPPGATPRHCGSFGFCAQMLGTNPAPPGSPVSLQAGSLGFAVQSFSLAEGGGASFLGGGAAFFAGGGGAAFFFGAGAVFFFGGGAIFFGGGAALLLGGGADVFLGGDEDFFFEFDEDPFFDLCARCIYRWTRALARRFIAASS